MATPKQLFYSSRFYQLFRYYIIRKKAPLSWFFWGNILGRHSSSQGLYAINIASSTEPDCAIGLNQGMPGDNTMEILIYDAGGILIDTVGIALSYKSMVKIAAGFNKAFSRSRKQIKSEKEVK